MKAYLSYCLRAVLAFCLLSPAVSLASDYAPQEAAAAKIEDLALRMRLDEARQAAAALDDDALREFYAHHLSFLETMGVQTKTQCEAFEAASENYETRLKGFELDKRYYFFVAEMRLERAIIAFLQKETWTAGNHLRKCYAAATKLRKQMPGSPLSERFYGMFQVAISAAPSQYDWALELLGLEGNLKDGIRRLKIAAAGSPLLRRENDVLLYFVYRNLMADLGLARRHAETALARSPKSVLFYYLAAHNALDRRANEEAVGVLETYFYKFGDAKRFPFMYYQLGKAALYKQDWPNARKYLDLYRQLFKGEVYATDARYAEGLTYALAGDKARALAVFREIAKQDAPVFDKDIYAWKQAKLHAKRYFTETELLLLRARYLTDGGYFDRAAQLLEALPAAGLNADDHCARHYLLARARHLAGVPRAAHALYKKAAAAAPERNLWMKAYAVLYLGQLHETAGNYEQARAYYRVALKFEDFDYERGLEQKALAGIERVKGK